MGLSKIVEGHVKELFNKEQSLYENRMKICNRCKLKTKDNLLGDVCSKSK